MAVQSVHQADMLDIKIVLLFSSLKIEFTHFVMYIKRETLAESRFIFIVAVTNQRKKEVKQAAVSLYTSAKRAHHFV